MRVGEWNTTTNPDCAVSTFGSDCAPEVIDVPIERQIPYKDKTSFRNDIGLLRLRREIEFGGKNLQLITMCIIFHELQILLVRFVFLQLQMR